MDLVPELNEFYFIYFIPVTNTTLVAFHCLYVPESGEPSQTQHHNYDYNTLQKMTLVYIFTSATSLKAQGSKGCYFTNLFEAENLEEEEYFFVMSLTFLEF